MKKFKTKKAIVAFALFAALVFSMSGTFAWAQISSKMNEFEGTKGGTLHDDFDPETGSKDIYMENTTNKFIFVRVKLNEAMDLTSHTWRPGMDDWVTHTPGNTTADCGHANADGEFCHAHFTWELGGQKWYLPADGVDRVVEDTTEYKAGDVVNGIAVKQTPAAEIVTMQEYLNMSNKEKDSLIGWIYDTDGYAYWSQGLKQNEVTGLLLHKVTTSEDIKDADYYYAIDVIAEAVDIVDLPMWISGAKSADGTEEGIEATNEAQVLLERFAKVAESE